MIEQRNTSLEAQYAQAIQLEKAALQALRDHAPGTDANAHAWQEWSEAIRRTNRAWRELSCQHFAGARPVSPRGAGPGAAAPSR